jgi:hypothetical protein
MATVRDCLEDAQTEGGADDGKKGEGDVNRING